MQTKVSFEDHGSQGVLMYTDIENIEHQPEKADPTPSLVLAVATKALFESGLLARAGLIVLEGISKKQDPKEYIKENVERLTNYD